VRPSLATTGGPLIAISSPYSRRGEVWEAYRRHYGPDGDARVLVAQGASRDFNPSLAQAVVDRAMERDPASALAEYGGQFRTDLEAFVALEVVRACIQAGLKERPPVRSNRYVGFVDPSGGSADSMTLAIAHAEGERAQRTAILDIVREVRPPFSPEAVCEEFAEVLRAYRVTKVTGDRYAGEWPREQFRKRGINYEVCEQSRSELYLSMLPLLNSRAIDLLDNERLVNQLVRLERRTARSGKDAIDHPPGAHDDLANAAAGAVVLASNLRSGFGAPAGLRQTADVKIGYAALKAKLQRGRHHPERRPPQQERSGAPPWRQ
jgi:hypothetical protein